MTNPFPFLKRSRLAWLGPVLLAFAILVAACASSADVQSASVQPTTEPVAAITEPPTATTEPASDEPETPTATAELPGAAESEPSSAKDVSTAEPASETSDFYNGDVRDIDVTFDQADFDAAVDTYTETRKKKWITATVTIDGNEYQNVGMRLKGNSSLLQLKMSGEDDPGGAVGGPPGRFTVICGSGFGLPEGFEPPVGFELPEGAEFAPGEGFPEVFPGGDFSSEPEDLPWLIRLDKYEDDQAHQGRTDYVVRSNDTDTSLNESVALALLGEAGLATQQSAAVRFSVNGSDASVRLVIEHPDNRWAAENLGEGSLFKADSTGDYSYRGEDESAYTDAWDQKSGEDDFSPLISFLDFVNNATDEEFADGLADRLDVEAFARYKALQDLIANWDDIDGLGNNSYLYFDQDGKATVVAWDHNLALMGDFFGGPGPGGLPEGPPPDDIEADFQVIGPGGDFPGDCELPEGLEPPEGFDLVENGFPADGFGAPNKLSTRFAEVPEFQALIDQAKVNLQAELVDSGRAADIIETRAAVLRDQVGDLLAEDVITREAESVESALVVG